MPLQALRFRPLLTALLATAACSWAYVVPTRSQESAVYTISNNDGYGIADCMRSGSDCGRVMADSWCEAHGRGHALSFGTGGDVTGTVGSGELGVKVAAGDVVIRCGEKSSSPDP